MSKIVPRTKKPPDKDSRIQINPIRKILLDPIKKIPIDPIKKEAIKTPDKVSEPPRTLIPVKVTKNIRRLDRVVAKKEIRFFTRSVIKKRLNSFVKNPIYSQKIGETVRNINRIALVAYHFINLHFLLLLRDKQPEFPKLNTHFFYTVCAHVTSLNGQLKEPKTTDSFYETVKQFRSILPSNQSLPYRDRSGALINNLITFLSTSCHNHLNLNFKQRFGFWIRIKHGISNSCRVKYIIDKIFDCREWPSKFDSDPLNEQLIQQYRVKFGNPTQKTKISENLETFLPFYYQMLMEFENQGKKLFNLFPLKTSLIPSHIRICSSSLRDLIASWTGNAANKDFLKQKRRGWSEIFRIDSGRTRKKWFSWEITTNGYDVSIGFRSPKSMFKYSEKQWESFQDKLKNKILDGLISKDKSSEEDSDQPPLSFSEKELNGLRMGLDPGMKALYTTIDSDGNEVQCSKGEYREQTGQKKFQEMINRRKNENPILKKHQAITFKTSDPLTYLENLRILFLNLDEVEALYSQFFYRKLRFTRYTKKQKVFRTLANRLKSKDGGKTILGYGNGSVNNSGISGNYLPVKGFRRYLERCFKDHIRVVNIDEFRTTKMCSSCEKETGDVYSWAIREGDDGEALVYQKKIYGIRRCESNECRITWNRDKNAARNILKLLSCIMEHQDRPTYLSRQKRSGQPSANSDTMGVSKIVIETVLLSPVLQRDQSEIDPNSFRVHLDD